MDHVQLLEEKEIVRKRETRIFLCVSELMCVIHAPVKAVGVITRRFCRRPGAIHVNGCLRFLFFHNVIGWRSFNRLRSPPSGLPLPLLLIPEGWRMVCVSICVCVRARLGSPAG